MGNGCSRLLYVLVVLIGLSLACSFPGASPTTTPSKTITPTRHQPTATRTSIQQTLTKGITPSPIPPTKIPSAVPSPTISISELIWVVNKYDRKVLKIESDTGKIGATVTLKESPILAVLHEESVWVAAFKRVYRLNAQNGQIEAEIDLGSYDPVSLEINKTGIWAGVIDIKNAHLIPLNIGYCPEGGLIHIDPKDNKIIKYIDLKIPAFYLSAADNGIWIDLLPCFGDEHKFVRLNLNDYSLTPYPNLSASIDPDSRGFYYQSESIWVPGKAGEFAAIVQIDPNSGKPDRKVVLAGTKEITSIGLTGNPDSLWAFDKMTARIYRIPPSGNEAVLIAQPDPKSGLLDFVLPTKQNLWLIWSEQARLVQINIGSRQIIREVATGMNLKTYSAGFTWQPCPAAYPSRLRVGDFATVSKDPPLPNRLRSEPNTSSTILGQIEAGGAVGIVDGPICNNNWIWWKVRTSKANLGGWTSEGDEKNYWLVPSKP